MTTLEVFLAVAETGNIARAADTVHMAASAISKRIADLECDLDVALFSRGRTGVALTPAGEALRVHARSLDDLAKRLAADLSTFASGAKGLVRVAANPSSITQYMAPILARFHAELPNVRIELLEEMSARTVRLVTDGAVDIGIVGESVDFGSLATQPFRRDRLAMLVPRRHPLVASKMVSYANTLDFPQVGLADGSSIQATLFAAARAASRSLDLVVRVASFDALRSLVAERIGIACLPVGCIEPYVRTHGLACVPLADGWANRQLMICTNRGPRPEPVKRFLKALTASEMGRP